MTTYQPSPDSPDSGPSSLFNSAAVIKTIRTVAQAIGGALVTFLATKLGVNLDANAVTEVVIYPICVGLWVILVDLLVRYVNPGFEALNIIKKRPVY